MSTPSNLPQVVVKNATSDDANNLFKALDALKPGGQSQKIALFAQAYEKILRAIARKVPQKDILSALSNSGLKLHPIRYRVMLEAESKLCNERGERICCETCGSLLQLPQASETPSAGENMDQNDQLDDTDQADVQS